MPQAGLLSVQDVSRILNITRRTLYTWIKKGYLEPIRIGKLYRFHPDDIDTILKQGLSRVKIAKRRKSVILAIDDDLLVRQSLKLLLEKSGYEVDCVESGYDAIKCMRDKRYDLILTDMRMPQMDGVETIKALREVSNTLNSPKVPEIVISAYNDDNARQAIADIGVKNFVVKPFDWEMFLSTIKQTLN